MVADSIARCEFETERLLIGPWHATADAVGADLAELVPAVLTPAATRDLPPGWRGPFDPSAMPSWIADRDVEAAMLLVVLRSSVTPVGFVALVDAGGGDVRIGYVLAEEVWGRGLATELVGGLVVWAGRSPAVDRLVGGVSVDHVASARVLGANGFSVRSGHAGVDEFHRDTIRRAGGSGRLG